MYKKRIQEQITFFDYNQGFGIPINEDNRWVQLAKKIPWDEIEEKYATQFGETGMPAIPARVALGALMIRRIMHLSDRGTVKAIQEGPYLQYFLGMERYTDKPPFDDSLMSTFRKRFDLDAMGEITDLVIEYEKKTGMQGGKNSANNTETDEKYCTEKGAVDLPAAEEVEPSIQRGAEQITRGILSGKTTRKEAMAAGANFGDLIIDATCCPVNIRYPQDFSLLNEAREKLESMLNRISKLSSQKKPRTYARVARKEYLNLAKSKKRSRKKIRHVVRIMLNCIKRNLRYLKRYLRAGHSLTCKEEREIGVIRSLYVQQKEMYEANKNRVDHRIVSLHMPFIRPIMRGKVPTPTEFGPKIDLTVDESGNMRISHFSYEAYNESVHLIEAIEEYKNRTGCYPERVLADTIYRNKKNRDYCKERGIQMSGPKLGRPSNSDEIQQEQKKKEMQDMVDRIEVERRFSRQKRCFGLDLIMEKREDTIGSSVGLAVLLDNVVPIGF